MVPLGKKKKTKSSFSPSWKWEGTSQGERALTQLLFLVHEMERKCREPGNLPGMRRQNLRIPESMSNPLWFRRSYLEGQQIWMFLIWRLVQCVPQREGCPCFHQAQSIQPPCPLLTDLRVFTPSSAMVLYQRNPCFPWQVRIIFLKYISDHVTFPHTLISWNLITNEF